MKLLVFWWLLLALSVIARGDIVTSDAAAVPQESTVVHYQSGTWFVAERSGLGPPLSQVKAYVLYNGTVCLTLTKHEGLATKPAFSLDEIAGLLCVPKAAP